MPALIRHLIDIMKIGIPIAAKRAWGLNVLFLQVPFLFLISVFAMGKKSATEPIT